MPGSVDVLVIGAGPAGSTIARLLAQWGYSVLLLKGPPSKGTAVESIDEKIWPALEVAGIASAVRSAGFHCNRGRTVWWGSEQSESEQSGYHVDRRRFDDFLLGLAERAGVQVRANRRAPVIAHGMESVEHDSGTTHARFIVDASGRAGLLARQIRRFWDPRYRSTALCAMFSKPGGWDVDTYHSLIEAYDRGWVWSAPLAADRRAVNVMVDSGASRGSVEEWFQAELERAPHFAELFSDCEQEGPVFTRDASPYFAERYAGANWILVGDAGSSADALAGSGIAKSIISAWTAAIAIDLCLRRHTLCDAAIESFHTREHATWLELAREAARIHAAAGEHFHTNFWRDRALLPPEYNDRLG